MEYSLGSIFKSLDMNYSNGLTDSTGGKTTVFQHYFFSQAKEKLNIDAIYFLRDAEGTPKIPLIYFSAMDTYDSKKIAELHRLAWNSGEAPLLFIVLPDQLLIYNNYAPPALRSEDGTYDNTAGLFEKILLVSELETQRKQLHQFHRIQIETGRFWEVNRKRFNINTRVDMTLMDNLKAIRKTLLTNIKKRSLCRELSDHQRCEIVHSLLGRSILLKYLEERTDSNNNAVFPTDFFEKFYPGAHSYADVLESRDATYRLFAELEDKFNGDIFPVSISEVSTITQEDLSELQQFLLGTSNLATQQTVLWPLYSFNAIPIQLISSIYELFFHLAETDPDKDNGTYYTPYHLVEMLMDEVLPWEGHYTEQKILDPSCGSGIFLVEAYRRLIARWIFTYSPENIYPSNLIEILQSCIFGVDCNKEAIRIASFSLSLAMCDFLEPRTIWNNMQFPNLLHNNLFHNDFFDCNSDFEKIDYSIVIGNPPWESKLSPAAQEYLKNTGYFVSDKQIAQAFTWRAGDICPNGTICLLLPSKSFLFNRSDTAHKFRTTFFKHFNVSVIINYSAFRRVLFEHAISPAVGVIYKVGSSNSTDPIFYCTPKPLYTIEDKRSFLIEPNNICRIPRNLIEDDLIWKIAMWGSPRDMDLIHTMQSTGTTFRKLFDEHGMIYAEGYKLGNRKNTCTDFLGMPVLNAKTFVPQTSDPAHMPKMQDSQMECTVKTKRSIFEAPHLIIKQSHKGSRFFADVLDFDAVFNHSFLGVHGNDKILKYCYLIISSKIFSYYQMMTNRRWLVERDEVEAGDILDTPIPNPSDESLLESEKLFDLISYPDSLDEIDRFVTKEYHLQSYETALVDDAIDYVYDFYCKKEKSSALSPPSDDMFTTYFKTLQDVFKNSLGTNLLSSCKIHRSAVPLVVCELDFSLSHNTMLCINGNSEEMNALLRTLDSQLLEERSGSVFVKRNVRIYGKDSICIVKPNQARYWNFSSACRDADDIYADIMRVWRDENE